MENKPEENTTSSSLEEPATSEDLSYGSAAGSSPSPQPSSNIPNTKKKRFPKMRELVTSVNIYFLLFIFILVLAAMIVFIGMQRSKKELAQGNINVTPLTQEELQEIQGSEAKVGDPKQTLSIESNSIFTGRVLMRDSLDVAGTIRVGGALSLPGITVSGNSNFDEIQANRLAIAGDTNIQGILSVQRNLNVSGGGSFGGPVSAPQINTTNLQLSGDLVLTRHIDAGGGTPSKSDGSALGNGGTSSVSGTDTSGTVAINTGGSPNPGCFLTVNFTQRFTGTPHVVITPVGPAGASLNYYVNRNSSGFSVCTANAAPGGQNIVFDYVAID